MSGVFGEFDQDNDYIALPLDKKTLLKALGLIQKKGKEFYCVIGKHITFVSNGLESSYIAIEYKNDSRYTVGNIEGIESFQSDVNIFISILKAKKYNDIELRIYKRHVSINTFQEIPDETYASKNYMATYKIENMGHYLQCENMLCQWLFTEDLKLFEQAVKEANSLYGKWENDTLTIINTNTNEVSVEITVELKVPIKSHRRGNISSNFYHALIKLLSFSDHKFLSSGLYEDHTGGILQLQVKHKIGHDVVFCAYLTLNDIREHISNLGRNRNGSVCSTITDDIYEEKNDYLDEDDDEPPTYIFSDVPIIPDCIELNDTYESNLTELDSSNENPPF